MVDAVLFDLDGTLVVEEPAAVASFEAVARLAAARHDGLDAGRLAIAARARARDLWYSAPVHPYCLRVGISSWEGLWCRFDGDNPPVRWLRAWSATYRRETWRRALAEQGVADVDLAEDLGERFGVERRARHETFADAVPMLAALRGRYPLGLVTNGASCLQREKLDASGLAGYFDVVVVSAEAGIGKPNPDAFRRAVAGLGLREADAVMVGDSVSRDVAGAIAAGLEAVWVNRSGRARAATSPKATEISTLRELPAVLTALG